MIAVIMHKETSLYQGPVIHFLHDPASQLQAQPSTEGLYERFFLLYTAPLLC